MLKLNHKIDKLFILAIITCMSLCLGFANVFADVKDGNVYQTAKFTNVPAHGGTQKNTTNGSRKLTSERYGTINGGNYGNLINPYCRFIDKNGNDKSGAYVIPRGIGKIAENSSVGKGSVLYTKVSTGTFEYNTMTITLKFSGDYIVY